MHDKIPDYYNYYNESPRLLLIRQAEIEFLSNAGLNGKILDLGCGDGYYMKLFYERGLDIYGVDISEKYLQIAKKYGQVFKMSVHALGFNESVFDNILCLGHVLGHMQKDYREMCINNIGRILKPGGKLLVSVWTYNSIGFKPDEDMVEVRTDNYEKPIELHFFSGDEMIDIFGKHSFNLKGHLNLDISGNKGNDYLIMNFQR